jgi:hypothetical protein
MPKVDDIRLCLDATAALSLEGIKNELAHTINLLRKKAGLETTDPTDVTVKTTDGFAHQAITTHEEQIKDACLLSSLSRVLDGTKDTEIIIGTHTTVVPFHKLHTTVGIDNGLLTYSKSDYPTYWHGLEALNGH